MHTAIRLAPDLESAAIARRSVEWFAKELDVDAAAASLVVTELVTNAVRHGGEPIVLHLRHEDESLFVEVSDGDSGDPHVCAADERRAGEGGGMGLLLVEQLSRGWGVRQSPRGWKTVWAEMACKPGASATWNGVPNADGLVAVRAHHERELADFERFLAVGERKLSAQATDEDSFGARVAAFCSATNAMREHAAALRERVAALHMTAAAMHERAAVLHERVATMADEQAQRLCDRYR
jgi:anti-sigma regulatory factor (Ser/Thr protein kinase)